MKDIHAPVRTLFYDLITGLGFTCYENGEVPDDAVTPYVIIVDITTAEISDKTNFGNATQILLDVVTSYLKAMPGGSLLADTMAGQILGIINSKTKFILNDPGLQIVNTKIIQDQKISQKSSTHKIYRRLLRYSQLIKEV